MRWVAGAQREGDCFAKMLTGAGELAGVARDVHDGLVQVGLIAQVTGGWTGVLLAVSVGASACAAPP